MVTDLCSVVSGAKAEQYWDLEQGLHASASASMPFDRSLRLNLHHSLRFLPRIALCDRLLQVCGGGWGADSHLLADVPPHALR